MCVCFFSLLLILFRLGFQVLDLVNSKPERTGPLNLNIVGHKDRSSSWVQEEGRLSSRKSQSYEVISG